MQNTQIRNIRRQRQSGFTLIELLIVVAIIGILAAVGVPQYNSYLDRAALSSCTGELSNFRSLVLAESATGDSLFDDEETLSNDAIDNFNFQACNVDDLSSPSKGDIVTAFINSGTVEEDVDAGRDESVSINDGQIVPNES